MVLLFWLYISAEAIHNKARTGIIFNPVSGIRNAAKDKVEIENVLGLFLDITFFETTLDVSAAELTRKALESGMDQIIASSGDVNMLLLAGIGVERGMVERADRELKTKYGALAYLVGGWQQLQSQELFNVELEIDRSTYLLKTGSITVANAATNTSVFGLGNLIDNKLN